LKNGLKLIDFLLIEFFELVVYLKPFVEDIIKVF